MAWLWYDIQDYHGRTHYLFSRHLRAARRIGEHAGGVFASFLGDGCIEIEKAFSDQGSSGDAIIAFRDQTFRRLCTNWRYYRRMGRVITGAWLSDVASERAREDRSDVRCLVHIGCIIHELVRVDISNNTSLLFSLSGR